MRKLLCRLLIALTLLNPLQLAQAGMIGTDQAAVLSFLDRADVASRLQALGVDPAQARSRAAALTGEELAALRSHIDSLPAGGIADGWAWAIVVLALLSLWWFMIYKR